MKKSTLFKMIWPVSIIIFALTIFSSCSCIPDKKSNQQETVISSRTVISKPPSSYTDTLIINSASAVFYNSDSLQLQKTRLVNKEMVYKSMVHDCFYQMRNAHIVLKKYWPQLKIIDTSRARYLLFIKENKSKLCIDLNTKNDMCGLFMFNQKKDPVLADMTNVDTALKYYFEE